MGQKRVLRVVVASPGDVRAERDALPGVFEEINRSVAADRDLLLELIRWETDAYPGFHPEGPQGLIDPVLKIEDCDILIGIFWKRFGTPTMDAQSGTEHEIHSAYQAWRMNRRPHIMVYFNQKAYSPQTPEEIEQWGRVLRFRKDFPKEGLWWPYKGKDAFETLVRQHLTKLIREGYPITTVGEPKVKPDADTAPVAKGDSVQKAGGGDNSALGTGSGGAGVEGSEKVAPPDDGNRPLWKRHPWIIIGVVAAFAAALFIGHRVYLHYWPRERRNPWAAVFVKSEKLDEHWLYPKGMWAVEPGEGAVVDKDAQTLIDRGLPVTVAVNKDDEALLVRGQEMGVPSDLGGKVFYDFTANFKVRFKSGAMRGAWVLRAQCDRQSGYLFELTQDEGSLWLSGWIYVRNHEVESIGSYQLPFNLLRESQSLVVDVTAKGNQFLYKITYDDSESDDNLDEGQPLEYSFIDEPKDVRWTWGTFGLLVLDDKSVMRIEYIYIYPLTRAAEPAVTTNGQLPQ